MDRAIYQAELAVGSGGWLGSPTTLGPFGSKVTATVGPAVLKVLPAGP
jgi:hypothetical protein